MFQSIKIMIREMFYELTSGTAKVQKLYTHTYIEGKLIISVIYQYQGPL
jgi:hypothetical protein